MQGIIKTFIWQKKFGFILSEGKEIFFHLSNFDGDVVLGQAVEFEIGPAICVGKPDQAINVRPVENAENGLSALAVSADSKAGQ